MAIFGVNLKRFDVRNAYGGIGGEGPPGRWIEAIVDACVTSGLGAGESPVVIFPPESAILPALRALENHPEGARAQLKIGSQGVYLEDVTAGGNFGAFTTRLPAAAVASMGATHTLIGHSEERKSLTDTFAVYDPNRSGDAIAAMNTILREELRCALNRELRVVFCVGETLAEKGEGAFDDAQKERVRAVLAAQLQGVLSDPGIREKRDLIEAIAYEPRWAIGPGRTPPGPDYIAFVAGIIRTTLSDLLGSPLPVLYGGGLKRENAAEIGAIEEIDGGLVALTKFTPPIAFDPVELNVIMKLFTAA